MQPTTENQPFNGSHGSQPVDDALSDDSSRTATTGDRESPLPGPPFARQRDAEGNSRLRTRAGEHPLPGRGDLARWYGRAVDRIERPFPLRAANLRDAMARVDTMIARRIEMIAQEEHERERFNVALADREVEIDEKLRELQARRDTLARPHDEKIDELRNAYASARARYAAYLAMAGWPLRRRDWGAGDDPEVTQNSPEIGKDDGAPTPLLTSTANEPMATNESAVPHPSHTLLDRIRRRFAGGLGTKLHWATGNAGDSPADADSADRIATAPQPTSIIPAAEVPTPTARPERRDAAMQLPDDAAKAQTKPGRAVALGAALPPELPSAEIVDPRSRLFALTARLMVILATVATGSIFGISIAILLGVIDTQSLAFGGSSVRIAAGVCAVIGICIFWAIGRTVQTLTAAFAESLFQSQLLSQGDDPKSAASAHRRTAFWTAGIGLLAFVGLISIEANVERAGIVSVFMQRQFSTLVASGQTQTPQSASDIEILSLCLIACLPYVLLHASDSWARTRARLLAAHISARQDSEAWTVAEARRADMRQKAQHDLDKSLEKEIEDHEADRQKSQGVGVIAADNAAEFSRVPATAAVDASFDGRMADMPRGTATTPTDGNRADDVEGEIGAESGVPPGTAPAPGDTVVDARVTEGDTAPSSVALNVALACSGEKARQAYSELRLAYRRRREALSRIDTRIELLDQEECKRRLKLGVAARQRIDDAEADLVQAVKAFDELFAFEQKRFEKWSRGGVWARFVDFFCRRPEGGSERY